MRVFLLTSDSPCQRVLAHRIARAPGVELVGLVIQEIPSTLRREWVGRALVRQPGVLLDKVMRRLLLPGVHADIARSEILWFPRGAGDWPRVPRHVVGDINGTDAATAISAAAPDSVVVSGTRMIRESVFAAAAGVPMVNLHTGISPFYKGGPNCSLWCLANREPQYIGVTAHVLDPGIDSGDLYLTAQTPLEPGDGVSDAVWRTVAHGHDIMVRVLGAFARGERPVAVPQAQVGQGRTYLTREWTVRHLARAVRFVRRGDLRRWIEDGRPGAAEVRLVDVFGGSSQGDS